MTTIPCKRPKVGVEPHPSGVPGAWQGICHVPGCATEPYNSVKTACEEFARRHRAEHREAVPATWFEQLASGRYVFGCRCGWQTNAGTVTRTDGEASLTHHLYAAHGLVVCP